MNKPVVKFLTIMFLLCVLYSLAACSNSTETTTEPNQNTGSEQETGANTGTETTGEKSIAIGITQSPSSLNPLDRSNFVNWYVVQLLFPPLVQLDEESMVFVPQLAESVENIDEQTFEVKLRSNAKWTDGTPVTVDDVLFTLGLLAHPEVNALRATDFAILEGLNQVGKLESGKIEDLTGAQKIDEHTIRFKTKAPVYPLDFQELILQNLSLLPKHVLGEVNPAQLFEHPFMQAPDVVYGPFKFVNYSRNQYVELEANPDYFLGAPKIDKLYFRISTPTNLVTMLESGDIDMNLPEMGRIPIEDYERVKNMAHIRTESGKPITSNFIAPNHKRMTDQRVRQAIMYAFNREMLVENLLKGEGEVSYGPYPPIHPLYNENVVKGTYPYDPEKAKQLLQEAGWDSSQTLSFYIMSGNSLFEQAANIIAENLRAVGINTQIETMDQPTLVQKFLAGDFDLVFWTTRFALYPDMSRTHATGGSTNFTGYSNPEVDELFKKGLTTTDPDERYDIYSRWQEIWVEDVPQMELFFDYRLRAVNERVAVGEPKDIGMFINVHEWDVK
jgi:peptide/nickel transport system substrate-binding protein